VYLISPFIPSGPQMDNALQYAQRREREREKKAKIKENENFIFDWFVEISFQNLSINKRDKMQLYIQSSYFKMI